MEKHDEQEFGELLVATLEVYGAKLTPTAIGIWCAALAGYSLADVRAALSAHVQSSKFSPKPADLIEVLQGSDGRPTADEAWADCPTSEKDTAVWTEETAAAYFEVAYEMDDRIAARMAFKGCYDRHVTQARRERKPMKWITSLGDDKNQRDRVIRQAVEMGRLTAPEAATLLPFLPDSDPLKQVANKVFKQLEMPRG